MDNIIMACSFYSQCSVPAQETAKHRASFTK